MNESKVEDKGIEVTTLTDIELAKHISDAMTHAAQIKEQATASLLRLHRAIATLQGEIARRENAAKHDAATKQNT